MAIITTNNFIIGGNFSTNPWQDGNTFTSIANGVYMADMFEYIKSGTMVHDASKTSDAPLATEAGVLSNDSLLLDVTANQAVIGAADFAGVEYKMEGYDAISLMEVPFQINFWVKSSQVGTYTVAVQNTGLDRSFVAEYTVGTANVWEFKRIHISASPSAGSWDYTNGIGFYFRWMLACGTNFHTANPDTWVTGDNRSTANQVNAVNGLATTFQIQLVSAKPATSIGSYEPRSFTDELQLSQRYYERSYELGTATGTASTIGAESMVVGAGDTNIKTTTSTFAVSKRNTPTVTTYDDAGNSGRIQLIGHASNIVPGSVVASEQNVQVSSPSGNAHTGLLYHYVADARL